MIGTPADVWSTNSLASQRLFYILYIFLSFFAIFASIFSSIFITASSDLSSIVNTSGRLVIFFAGCCVSSLRICFDPKCEFYFS